MFSPRMYAPTSALLNSGIEIIDSANKVIDAGVANLIRVSLSMMIKRFPKI